jgi:hypothetical protein
MRRVINIGFFAAAVGLALLIYVRGKSSDEGPDKVAPAEPAALAPPTPSPSPTPKLALPAPTVVPDAVAAKPPVHDAERALMVQIRALVKSDPARAEALARQARERFPNGRESDERDALLVDALINQQHIGAARSETYYYLDHHPHGRFIDHLTAMTGVHPAPSRATPPGSEQGRATR